MTKSIVWYKLLLGGRNGIDYKQAFTPDYTINTHHTAALNEMLSNVNPNVLL